MRMRRIRKRVWFLSAGIVAGYAGLVIYFMVDMPCDGGGAGKANADLKGLSVDLNKSKQQSGSYPTDEAGLESLVNVHIRPEGLIDPWGRPYQYIASYNAGAPMVWSFGEDGKGGTSDDLYSRKLE